MSHFPVLIIGDNIDEQLAPFDENLDVEPYLDSLDGEWIPMLEKARAYYRDNETGTDTTAWTDLQFLRGYAGDQWRASASGRGFERWSTYSPASKWDWWVTGGRWQNFLELRDGSRADSARIRDVDLEALLEDVPFALVKDGQWMEKGRMGWFGMSTENKTDEAWTALVREALDGLPDDTALTIVDCHI
jgi:hypothetical protein